ncbi:MAG: response regulator [Planctomycetes bacterium]|nr:response regulator [Planctomycetota bacterium]
MSAAILIVDDNPDNLKLLRWTLEDEGYDVTEAITAEEALDQAGRQAFDLVLMDISLPGMDGKEAIRRLRKMSQYASTPIFAVTAHAIQEEQQEIQSSGVTDVIHKPIDIKQLLNVIQQHVHEEVTHD